MYQLEDFGHIQKYYYYGLKAMHKDLGVPRSVLAKSLFAQCSSMRAFEAATDAMKAARQRNKRFKFDVLRDGFIQDVDDPALAQEIDTKRNRYFNHVGSMLAYPVLSGGEVRGILLLATREGFEAARRSPQPRPEKSFLLHLELFCRNLGQMDQVCIPLHRREVERHIKQAIPLSSDSAGRKEAIRHLCRAIIVAGFRRARIFRQHGPTEETHTLIGSVDTRQSDQNTNLSDNMVFDDWLKEPLSEPVERKVSKTAVRHWKDSSGASHHVRNTQAAQDIQSFGKNGRDWALVPVIVSGSPDSESEHGDPPRMIGFITADKKPYLRAEIDLGLKPEENEFSEENLSMLTLVGAAAGMVLERLTL